MLPWPNVQLDGGSTFVAAPAAPHSPHETPLTFDDGKSATARREGGAGDHRGRAHAPAYEQPRGSMY